MFSKNKKNVEEKLREITKYFNPNMKTVITSYGPFWYLPITQKLIQGMFYTDYLYYLAKETKSPEVKRIAGEKIQFHMEAYSDLTAKSQEFMVPEAFERVLMSFSTRFPSNVDGEIKRILYESTNKNGPTNQEWINWLEEHRHASSKLIAVAQYIQAKDPGHFKPWFLPKKFEMQYHVELARSFQRLLEEACEAQDAISAPKNKRPKTPLLDLRVSALKGWADGPFPLKVFLKEYDPRYHPRGKDYMISDMLRIAFGTQHRHAGRFTKGFHKSVDEKFTERQM